MAGSALSGGKLLCKVVKVATASLAFISLFGCGSGGGGGEVQQAGTKPVGPAPLQRIVLGVGSHIFSQDIDNNLRFVKQLGLSSVRDDFTWATVEKTRGVLAVPAQLQNYNEMLAESGVAPLMILDYGNDLYNIGKPVTAAEIANFVNYARFSATAMADSVAFFEIWNEWNNKSLPNSPESYLNLVKATAPKVKAASPRSLVLAGSSNLYDDWTVQLVRLGVMRYVDGVSVHAYIHCEHDMRPENVARAVERISAKLRDANAGEDVPLYITEVGWPTNTSACGSTPESTARYVARTLLLLRTVPSVRGVWWYDLKDDGIDPENMEHNFGLLDYDYQPKPAFAAMADVAPVVQGKKRFTRLPTEPGLVVVQIEEESGGKSYALWTENGKKAAVTVTLKQKPQGRVYDLQVGSAAPREIAVPFPKGEIVVSVGEMPQIISGAAALTVQSINWP